MKLKTLVRTTQSAVLLALASFLAPAQAWEPTKPIEFVVPAGTGGGADQMARFIQGVVAKNKLSSQPIIVVNKSGGAGAEGTWRRTQYLLPTDGLLSNDGFGMLMTTSFRY